jgi:hypothetical protein
MVVVSVLDSRLVPGVPLQGGVRPTKPSQGGYGLGEDHEKRQDVRGRRPRQSGIEREVNMKGQSYQPLNILRPSPTFGECLFHVL